MKIIEIIESHLEIIKHFLHRHDYELSDGGFCCALLSHTGSHAPREGGINGAEQKKQEKRAGSTSPLATGLRPDPSQLLGMSFRCRPPERIRNERLQSPLALLISHKARLFILQIPGGRIGLSLTTHSAPGLVGRGRVD